MNCVAVQMWQKNGNNIKFKLISVVKMFSRENISLDIDIVNTEIKHLWSGSSWSCLWFCCGLASEHN